MSNDGYDGSPVPSRTGPGLPDAHGEAALVLIESLIHAILVRGVLSLNDTLEIAQTAIDVQHDICIDRDEEPARAPSLQFLEAIAASLRTDQSRKSAAVIDPGDALDGGGVAR